MPKVTRREALLGGAAAAAGLAVGAFGGNLLVDRSRSRAEESVDVAVIGAGVSGAFVGARLAQEGRRSVVLFEATTRVGGRLWSQPLPQVPGLVAELGGMRIPKEHHDVTDLISELSLQTEPFPSANDDSLVYLRGTRMRLGDVTDVGRFRYALAPRFAEMTPEGLLGHVARAASGGDRLVTRDEESGSWADGLALEGRPLFSMSAAELLSRTIGSDGARFMFDWTGYDIGAASATTWLGALNSFAGQCFQVVGGFQKLPVALVDTAVRAGLELRTGQRLFALEHDGKSFRLRFLSMPEGEVTEVSAQAVVLALPTGGLRELSQNSELLRGAGPLQAALGQIVESQACKAYLAYEYPWWTEVGIGTGRTVSDSVLRQTFYMTEDPSRPALLLAAYAYGDVPADLLTPVAPEATPERSTDLVDGAAGALTAALSEVHGIPVPPPIGGAVQRWAELSGVAVPLWGPGNRPWQLSAAASAPVSGIPLYLCGDALSLNQGWVLGALQTAKKVLAQGFSV